MMMSINTKKYIEKFVKIKNKNAEIINFKFNPPQNKMYEIIQMQVKKKNL